jgi:hypothetical protein
LIKFFIKEGKVMKRNPSKNNIILFAILSLFVGGLMLMVSGCPGEIDPCAVNNTKFCAIVKELAPSSVQPALEDCQTLLTICDGKEIELYWQADASLTSNVHITGPGGEVYDFPISEGHATVTPHVSGKWEAVFSGKCRFTKSINVRVIKGPEPYTIVANGNIDVGFVCNINPKAVDKDLIIIAIRSAQCAGVSEYWENWSCKKTNWDGSYPTFFNITKNDGSANNTHLSGYWRFDPSGLGGTFTYSGKSACFQATICCEPCDLSPTDIYPSPTPTPWPTRSPR